MVKCVANYNYDQPKQYSPGNVSCLLNQAHAILRLTMTKVTVIKAPRKIPSRIEKAKSRIKIMGMIIALKSNLSRSFCVISPLYMV